MGNAGAGYMLGSRAQTAREIKYGKNQGEKRQY